MDLNIIVFIIACVVFFTSIRVIFLIKNTAGTLYIDSTDEEIDRYSIEFSIPLSKLPKKKSVILRIKSK